MRLPVFCIGASAGGVNAILEILSNLDPQFPNPVVVTQHIAESSRQELDLQLVFGRHYAGRVVDIMDKTPVRDHNLFFAPGGYHLLVEKDFTFALSQDEPVHFSRPAIDLFFETAAAAFGKDCCGILLTGASDDGAAGLHEIKKMGGLTIVQDPATAECPVMPQSAINLFKPDHILSLKQISKLMMTYSQPEVTA